MCTSTTTNVTLVIVIAICLLWPDGVVLHSDAESKCKSCKEMTENFTKGLEKTKKHNFGGGNTDWEESRLGSYANSETRLLEILEDVCEKVTKESYCHAMMEEHETVIYDWWFKRKSENPDMHKYICIEQIQLCCPKNKFGPTCKECPGGIEKPCTGHGDCEGEGTRGGKGECSCNSGYKGDVCDDCDDRYYDAGNNTCEECDNSCKDICSGAGSKGCDDCKEGWTMKDGEGCLDKNECEENPPCQEGEYCINNIGSFDCKGCHESCDGNCTGDGPGNCLACKSGYKMHETEECKDVDECSQEDICHSGTYCLNKIGTYECEVCHESCEFECTGPGPKACKACKSGYRMDEGECKDVDECVEEKIACDGGEYCQNTQGSHQCSACDSACSSCISSGAEGCTKCSAGYVMGSKGCEDVNECSVENTCDKSTEKCVNTNGSFKCKCKSGYSRKDDKCVKKTKSDDDDDDDEDSSDHDEL